MVKEKFVKHIWSVNVKTIKFNKRKWNIETFNVKRVFLIVIENIGGAKSSTK